MQSGYFFPENSLLTSESLENIPDVQTNVFADTPAGSFADILSRQDADGAKKFLDTLYQNFFKNHRFLQNPVKDMYYKLFLCLEDARHQQKIAGSGNVESIAETIDDCFTFPELHQTLVDKTSEFFRKAESSSQENPTIFLIKDYISQNYMHETLSVKDISEHVFLSTSYVCTFFKSETGQTLNQYLTEYRMEKAKQLLKDARFKISLPGSATVTATIDGVGISPEILPTILSGNGNSTSGGTNIAIYNTHRRLQILYGPDYGLTYSSEPGHGTEVEIRIPAKKETA